MIEQYRNSEMTIQYINWDGRQFFYDRYYLDTSRLSLKEFEGLYYSEEIGIVYTLKIRNDDLIIEHPRLPEIKLSPISNNLFLGNKFWFKHVEFERDSNKNITGFKVSCERVRNLYFEKFDINE